MSKVRVVFEVPDEDASPKSVVEEIVEQGLAATMRELDWWTHDLVKEETERLTDGERQLILQALRYLCVPPKNRGWAIPPWQIELMKKLEGTDKVVWVETA